MLRNPYYKTYSHANQYSHIKGKEDEKIGEDQKNPNCLLPKT